MNGGWFLLPQNSGRILDGLSLALTHYRKLPIYTSVDNCLDSLPFVIMVRKCSGGSQYWIAVTLAKWIVVILAKKTYTTSYDTNMCMNHQGFGHCGLAQLSRMFSSETAGFQTVSFFKNVLASTPKKFR